MDIDSTAAQQQLKSLLITLAGALLFMLGAFYNSYPLVYSDTSTYLSSGFELETPFDRPIMYGLFIRAASLNGISLWLVLLAQAALLSYLILLICRQWFPEKKHKLNGLSILGILSVFTGLSWVASEIMPDIFTPICLLCIILIITHRNLSRREITALYLIFLFANAMHFSHILMNVALLFILLLVKWMVPNKFSSLITYRKLLTLFLLLLAGIATMTAALSKSRHVFTMGTLVENGILKKYLDENCATENYGLCAFKDSLPKTAVDFIWRENSPLVKMGGWKATKTEYHTIINATYTQPRFIWLHIVESIKSTLHQLTRFSIGDGNAVFTNGTELFERIASFIPAEKNAFHNSRQNSETLHLLKPANAFFMIIMMCSILLIPIVWVINHSLLKDPHDVLLQILLLTGVFLNAWVSGTFANAIDRLGCKMMWILVFMLLLMIFRRTAFAANSKKQIS